MIIKEYYTTRFDGVELEISFSDQGLVVVRDGVSYDEAVDIKDLHREYEEGRILVSNPTTAVSYWVRKIKDEEKSIEDVPEWMRSAVEEALRN